jgi:hypothetical protein
MPPAVRKRLSFRSLDRWRMFGTNRTNIEG